MNIVITGSTQGIGLGLAREFLRRRFMAIFRKRDVLTPPEL
jgi:NAD(P)-dependent dehydrogenase (short-subunit alcohol dehydrogenase family)